MEGGLGTKLRGNWSPGEVLEPQYLQEEKKSLKGPNGLSETGAIAQAVKCCLSCKHNDLCLILRTQVEKKPGVDTHIHTHVQAQTCTWGAPNDYHCAI